MKIVIIIFLLTVTIWGQEDSVRVASQNPSPMIENTRTHERINQVDFNGISIILNKVMQKPVEVYIPGKSVTKNEFDILVHFHGGAVPVKYAAEKYNGNLIAADINFGTGSSVYYKSFSDSSVLPALIDSIKQKSAGMLGHQIKLNRIILSGFSAGYGAIKKILGFNSNYKMVDAVLLLDGLHASYVPERKVLYEGGSIDSSAYNVFIKLAKDAAEKNSGKKFLFTHSEIFPGTFVSTTESADFLLSQLNIKPKPVLIWGPLGMQQLSTAGKNHFRILGFAGNTAPDHVDHFQALYFFLNKLIKL